MDLCYRTIRVRCGRHTIGQSCGKPAVKFGLCAKHSKPRAVSLRVREAQMVAAANAARNKTK